MHSFISPDVCNWNAAGLFLFVPMQAAKTRSSSRPHWFLTSLVVGNKVQSAGPGKGSLQLSNASLLVPPKMRIGRFGHSSLGCTAVGDHGMLTRSGPTNSIAQQA